jgi:hypothetical protein
MDWLIRSAPAPENFRAGAELIGNQFHVAEGIFFSHWSRAARWPVLARPAITRFPKYFH